MKKSLELIFVSAMALTLTGAEQEYGEREERVYSHCCYQSKFLDGAWEMAYSPYDWTLKSLPKFQGAVVTNAIPGYWEDMIPAFRQAGIQDEFRIHPRYEVQQYPITGSAMDTTFPNLTGTFFYRRKVTLQRTRGAVLAFEGVRNQVSVWVNGAFVARHEGYSTPFELPVPEEVLTRGENEIVLAVSNGPVLGYCDHVIGLTSRATFGGTGGVNGHLELRFVGNSLGDVYVTTAADLKTFTIHTSGRVPFEYEIRDGERTLAQGCGIGAVTLSARGYEFWSPEHPRRYTLRLKTPEGSYGQRFGLRRLTAEGERLKLNGEFVYLRGVTEHCYFPKTMHLPRDLGYYRMITKKRKELGFNFVRFHTFVPPVEYLEATDELGMLVHLESPNFTTLHEYAEIIAFARRHPSVVIYCTGNETRIDRLAEAYLEQVAAMVHSQTDSLFSPMSALRGLEYALMPGLDPVVNEPFKHNAERFARVAKYTDLFTSYQLSMTSYDTLTNGTAEVIDRHGDAYCGKPRLAHEICIDGSYADLKLEQDYPPDSPMLKVGMFSGVRQQLKEKGLLDRADTYFRNSSEWMRRIRKHAFEKLRLSRRTVGYDFLGDINTHWHTFGYSVGMMDEFYRLKPGETVENVRRYNSAAVLLADLGNEFNLVAGTTKRVVFTLSNYSGVTADSELQVSLVGEDGQSVFDAELDSPMIANGTVAALGEVAVKLPKAATVKKYLLRASMEVGETRVANEWEIYAYPPETAVEAPASVKVVNAIAAADLQARLQAGERVMIVGAGPFKAQETSFQIALAGRCSGNYATVIRPGHPIFAQLPHDGYCGWQFRHLLDGGQAIQLERGVAFDPIVDIASSVKCVIRQAMMFEYSVGPGKLLVCGFNFVPGDPASVWLWNRLCEYVAGDQFQPASAVTAEELQAAIDAPLVTGAVDTNRAKNDNDPSSAVRAEALAQP